MGHAVQDRGPEPEQDAGTDLMTMEFLTLNDAQAQTETKVGKLILQNGHACFQKLLQRMCWRSRRGPVQAATNSWPIPDRGPPGDTVTMVSDQVDQDRELVPGREQGICAR